MRKMGKHEFRKMKKHEFRKMWKHTFRKMGKHAFLKCMIALMGMVFLWSPGMGRASGTWYLFDEHSVPENLGFRVSEYTGTVKITFLGDCTLGGEEKSRNSSLGFNRRIKDNGMAFPMRYLSRLTAEDDISVANLEGVLTDRKLEKVEKTYNFSGPTSYTEILTSGEIECVTLANNHSHDYGEEGYRDTKAALNEAGVAFFGTDCMAVWENEDGLLIGFVGAFYSVTGNRGKAFRRQAECLKDLGCAAVIAVMHAGEEYVYTPDSYQKHIAETAAEMGVCLLVGHHPHVVQGYDFVSGMPVVYSLGNCSFGGTTHAKDSDALVVQAELSFEDSTLEDTVLRFYPISITSDARYNNYSPEFLTGDDARRVLQKMEESTGRGFGPFDEENGATIGGKAD